ncbi:MAG: SDR family NAD(P)-dependent oxidoreductase [Nakamurella multipartita]
MTISPQRTAVITGVGAERGIGRAHRAPLRPGRLGHCRPRPGRRRRGGKAGRRVDRALRRARVRRAAVDVADEASVLAVQDAVAAANLPTVGAVLNIASITSPVPFLDTTVELWNRIFAVNVTGTYLVTKAFLRT